MNLEPSPDNAFPAAHASRQGRAFPALASTRIVVASRCAMTLARFRSSLMRAVMEQGAEVLSIGAGGDGFESKLQDAGIPFEPIPVSRQGIRPLADLRLLASLHSLFRRGRPDLVHSFTIKPVIFGTLAAALAGVPARVVTITGLGHTFTTASRWVGWTARQLYRMALRLAHVVFFQNPDDRELFIRLGLVRENRARLAAGSGVDCKRFGYAILPVASGTAPRFIMIGRLLREKGVGEYHAAARKVHDRYPEVQFLLVGGIDPRNPSSLDAAALAQLRESSHVELHDEVDDVRPLIAAADVAVLPSYREGLPRFLLEAAAMGRALITTDTPGCREVVTHGVNGYLVPVQDANALAQAIIRLIENPAEIIEMGKKGRVVVEQRYDERLVIDQTLSAYEDLLKHGGARNDD